jgi:hypothetical protein
MAPVEKRNDSPAWVSGTRAGRRRGTKEQDERGTTRRRKVKMANQTLWALTYKWKAMVVPGEDTFHKLLHKFWDRMVVGNDGIKSS